MMIEFLRGSAVLLLPFFICLFIIAIYEQIQSWRRQYIHNVIEERKEKINKMLKSPPYYLKIMDKRYKHRFHKTMVEE